MKYQVLILPAAKADIKELKSMKDDPIVEEIRQVRETHAAKFNYDLWAIYKDIKEYEKQSKRTYVSYPPKTIQTS